VIVFFREQAPIAGLVVIGLLMLSILLLSPYLHRYTDALQLVVQIELFVLLLAAHTLQSNPESADLLDVVLSVVLLAASLGVVALAVYCAVMHVRAAIYAELRAKALNNAVLQADFVIPGPKASTPRSTGSGSSKTEMGTVGKKGTAGRL
jgi:hypothetical protein